MNNKFNMSRRTALGYGLCGAGGLLMANKLSAAQQLKPLAKAKSVIQIFLWGGMSHNDTWDPKPEAGRDYMGEFMEVLPTNVDGIQIGQLFPKLLNRPTNILSSAA